MVKSLGIVLIAALILWIEVPTLLKKKQKKELIIFSIFLAFGVTLCIMLGFGIAIPNPLEFLTFIFKPLNELKSRFLK